MRIPTASSAATAPSSTSNAPCTARQRRSSSNGLGGVGKTTLTQALAFYAQNTRSLDAAQRLYQRLADHEETHGEEGMEAGVHHQLGVIALHRHDLDKAEDWYRKALAIAPP